MSKDTRGNRLFSLLLDDINDIMPAVKWMKKAIKIILITFISIIALLLLVVLGLNIFKYAIYHEYYSIRTNVAINEGLGSGYIPQGITKVNYDNSDYYLTSGYMSNGSASRIYVIDKDGYYYVNIFDLEGNLYDTHFGGIAYYNEMVYISTDSEVYIISFLDILSSKEDKQVEAIDVVKTRTAASFMCINQQHNLLYVGEFNNGKEYQTNHEEKVNDGKNTYYAYVDVYEASSFSNDSDILYTYAIRDKVQGFAISDDKIVLSTSFGLASSYFYVYDIPSNFDKENVYYLDDRYLTKTIKGPAMAEGITYDYNDDKFITLFESASNKYFFGKLFFANKIVALDIK